jgi:type IV secretion system protein VirB10
MATIPEDPSGQADDIRPIVGRPAGNRAVWIFAGLLAIAGVGLFATLQSRREALTNAVAPAAGDVPSGEAAAPAQLAIPGADESAGSPGYPYTGTYMPAPAFRLPKASVMPLPRQVIRPPAPRVSLPAPAAIPAPAYPSPAGSFPLPLPAAGPALVYQAPSAVRAASGEAGGKAADEVTRTHAGRLANPADTVPEGTVVQAVMETALDSSRAGFTRAIVSRDVRGFDGSQVLIPRGSRLYGEYQADVDQGQGRALIRWQRLLRPDGVTMNLDSPATDPLGRAGVKGHVNSHFLARFGGAILQSVLNIGVGLASRPLGNGVYVNLPQGVQQGVAVPTVGQNVHPTLTIPPGTSVSVYVAHDLDFSATAADAGE